MTGLSRDLRHDPVLRDEIVAALAIAPGERHVDATFGAERLYARAARGGCRGRGLRPRSRCDRRRPVARRRGRWPADAGPRPLRRDRPPARRARHRRGRRYRLRYRRLVDAARPRRTRLFVPERRAAEHDHGAGWRDRRQLAQSRRRSRDCRRALSLWRRAPVAACRARDRRGAAAVAYRRTGGGDPQGAAPPARRAEGSGDPQFSGDPHPHQRRARRTQGRARRRRTAAASRRPARGGQLPQHRGPDREEFPARTQRWRCPRVAPPARANPRRGPQLPAAAARKVRPGKDEEARNPRARSATLRSAVRTDAAAWSAGTTTKEAISC